MKTKKELEQIKEEYIELSKKLAELTKNELAQVTGGISPSDFTPISDPCVFEPNSAQQGGAIYLQKNN